MSEPEKREVPEYRGRAVELAENTVLTRRQSEVCALKEMGFTHQEIADFLGITKSTVDTLSEQINNRKELAENTVIELGIELDREG